MSGVHDHAEDQPPGDQSAADDLIDKFELRRCGLIRDWYDVEVEPQAAHFEGGPNDRLELGALKKRN